MASTQTTTVIETTRLVRLSYLQTIAALDDQAQLSALAGETQGSQSVNSSSSPGSPGFLGTGIGGEDARSQTTTFNDTGWSISRTWLETWWDKIRWGIGLKEIGIFSYNYVESSEIISVPFISPKGIQSVSLKVDDQIPESFPSNQSWIQYFISADNGNQWIRINPMDKPTVFQSGSGRPLPRTIRFSVINDSENTNDTQYQRVNSLPTSIRFRAVLLRPSGAENQNKTPILKSYRMTIYPQEGL